LRLVVDVVIVFPRAFLVSMMGVIFFDFSFLVLALLLSTLLPLPLATGAITTTTITTTTTSARAATSMIYNPVFETGGNCNDGSIMYYGV
jgi:hypothetical protein